MKFKQILIKLVYNFLGKYFPKFLTSFRYKRIFKKKLNWNSPSNINEKINWLKFNTDTTKWSFLADKYRVREFIIEKGFEEILVNLYGKWDNVEQIEWDKLPNSFVLKMNNGSGDIIVCDDKSNLDFESVKDVFRSLLRKPFGYATAEPHYSYIKPCIIAEELLHPDNQATVSDTLIDYKIWCFNGKPESIWACRNRHKDSVEVALYDLDWNHHPEYSVYTHHYIKSELPFNKPNNLKKMIEVATALSMGFPQVRVDLYEVDDRVYFGEMTFTSNFGMMEFYTEEYLEYLGSKIELNL